MGAPGIITNITVLEKSQSLRTFIAGDIFGYGESEVKVLEKSPKLNRLYLESIPKEAGAYPKKRWKNKLDTLEITHFSENENPRRMFCFGGTYVGEVFDGENNDFSWAVLSKWKGVYQFTSYYSTLQQLEQGL